MAIFNYKAISSQNGKEYKGSVTADNLILAKQKLNSEGVMLLNIKEKTTKSGSKQFGALTVGPKIKIADLSLMTRQLSTLIRAKIPISEALAALIDQVDHPTLRVIMAEVRQKINEGASLARAFSDYPKVFNNIYVNMVEAGEASGNLEVVLLRLAEFTEGQTKLKNKIISAMLYPMIMGGAGMTMLTFIFVVIIPKITKIFVSTRRAIPVQTQICIGISNFVKDYWWLMAIVIPLTIYLLKLYIKRPKGRSKWHTLQLKIPLMSSLIKMINIGRFCSTLSTLLTSGVPILASLRIVNNLISNVHIQKAVEQSTSQVAEGASMTGPLVNSGLFPPMVTHMIRLGEKSGELESMLGIVAENYQDQVNSKLDGLTSILEPIMMICLGGVVGFVVMAIVIPLMELNKVQ